MTAEGRPKLHDMVTTVERAESYRASGDWDDVTLSDRVRAWAYQQPGKLAVVDRDGGRRHDYQGLEADVAALSAWLVDRGIGAGDVVSIQLPNWYEFVVLAVATQRLGAVINPLLPVYRRKELLHVLSVARPKVLCTPAHYRGHDHLAATAAIVAEAGEDIVHLVVSEERPDGCAGAGGVTVWYGDARAAGSAVAAPLGDGSAGSVSEVIFTSGTEASPKAVMHTEQTANFSVRTARDALGVGPGDVVWMPSPIGHSTGFNYGVRFAVYHGLPLVLQDRWDPAVGVGLIMAERCSYTLASTTFLQDLVGEAERRGIPLECMSRFGCGGSPVPAELVQRAAACRIGVLRLYGSTEVLVATWNRPGATADRLVGTDGPALPGVEVAVRDDAGASCPPGVAGEIAVRGPDTCVGFWGDPERVASTFDADGWVRSGDLGTLDADGYLTVVGRKKEIIIRGGMNITPREIEDLLLDLPEVERVAVVGMPDERLGERVCACVVPAAGATLDFDTMIDRLRSVGLANYKLPQRLELLDQLPMTASGKVQKFELVRRLAGISRGDPS